MSDKLDELLNEIERLRKALEAIQNTPRSDGILTCQRLASDALKGGEAVLQPERKSLGDPLYYRDVIQYLHWRFRGKCAYCRADGAKQIDHVRPVSRGGRDDITNLVLACEACNRAKGAQTAEEFGFRELALLTIGQTLIGWRKVRDGEQRSAEKMRQIFGPAKNEEPF